MTRSYLAAIGTVILARSYFLSGCERAVPHVPPGGFGRICRREGRECRHREIKIVWRVKLHSRHTTSKAAIRIALTSAKASGQT